MRRKENSSRKEINLGGNQNARKYRRVAMVSRTPNFLTGYRISGPIVGKRDSLKTWHGMRNWEGKRVFGIEMTEVWDARS